MAGEHHSVSDERPQQRRLRLGNGLIVDAAIIVAVIALLARELVRPSNWRAPPDIRCTDAARLLGLDRS